MKVNIKNISVELPFNPINNNNKYYLQKDSIWTIEMQKRYIELIDK